MLNFVLILLLKLLAFRSSFLGFKKKESKNPELQYLCLITTLTNLVHLVYLLFKISGINNDNFNQNITSILVPNIIIMSVFYWAILSPNFSVKSNLTYGCLYLHLFSALFVISEYLKSPIKLSFIPNLYWTLFVWVMIIINRFIVGKWSYENLTNINKTHAHLIFYSYGAIILSLVRILNYVYF